MNKHQNDFLNLVNLPARFTAQQTAWYLNFQLHEIPILVKHGLLIPIDQPAPNAPKFFLKCYLDELRVDEDWQKRARKCTAFHWFEKNHRKNKPKKSSSKSASHSQSHVR